MKSQIYRLSPKIKSTITQTLAASLLLIIIISAFALFAPPRDKNQLVPMFGLLIFAGASRVFLWVNLSACDAYIEITEEFIAQHQPRQPTIRLLWTEISQPKNNPLMQRLELSSQDGKFKIKVEHQLEDFARLKQLIESKIAP